MSVIKQNYGDVGAISTQNLIAPVLFNMIADRNFAVNDEFIVDNVLYRITSSVTSGQQLIIGTNCVVSDTISQQIKGINDYLTTGTFTITKTNAVNNFAARYANSIVHLNPFSIDAGTYTAAISYDGRYYATVGIVPSSIVSVLFPNSSTSSAGSAITFGLLIYEEQTSSGIAYRDYSNIMLYKGTGSGTALNTWYLIVTSFSSTTSSSIVLSNKRYFMPFPFICIQRTVDS